jgi:hypothetical protein
VKSICAYPVSPPSLLTRQPHKLLDKLYAQEHDHCTVSSTSTERFVAAVHLWRRMKTYPVAVVEACRTPI